ncbi:MAG: hypothetical protein D9C04_04525 [Nitrosopumilus sp. B06]|nr:MAG: hypothetical protein EB828_00525 [Nitrosopumilus sp. D6]RNJ79483.1 MAG: hypothetical protein D9C04_04525 [Nitrosopumilus sp. B06]
MMGDRDFRSIIKNAIGSISRELNTEIDAADTKTIHIQEATQCMRRSYYDRTDSMEIERRGFNELLSGLLRKLEYGSKPIEYATGDSKLIGQADMVVDDSVLLFRSASGEMENPLAGDILYLNACLWIYDKTDGMIIYITNNRKETTFSLTRDKKMFEEVIRRSKVLGEMLEKKRTPIIEPSPECSECQYYERCFVKRTNTKQLSIAKMFGMEK